MIRHVVFFSAKNKRDLEAIRNGLMVLEGIPQARVFEVAENCKSDPLSSDADLVVYAEFDDEAALAAYRAHPLYAEAIRLVRPLRDLRISADFLSEA